MTGIVFWFMDGDTDQGRYYIEVRDQRWFRNRKHGEFIDFD